MKHSFPLFLGHAPPSRSTVPHSRALTFQGSRHLDHRHYTAVSGYGSATVDARGSQCLKPSTGDDYAVSVSEALQLPGRPIIPTPLLARSSDLTRYLCRESGVRHFRSILPSSHCTFRVHKSHYRWAMSLAKIECHLSMLLRSIIRVTIGLRRATPPTTSRTTTPHFPHRTQILYRRTP
ncbi:hypothetical protein EDD17DRAFT_1076555 [Pisolithus thermaeus]|nr:hypothetical protein EDD17DRAFT_1076555 [Pisolithus thermaeus]